MLDSDELSIGTSDDNIIHHASGKDMMDNIHHKIPQLSFNCDEWGNLVCCEISTLRYNNCVAKIRNSGYEKDVKVIQRSGTNLIFMSVEMLILDKINSGSYMSVLICV